MPRTPPHKTLRETLRQMKRDGDYDRIVTPDTDPDLFTRPDVIVFRSGKCCWAIDNGHFGETFCLRTSRYTKRLDYQERIVAWSAAHQRNCTSRDCYCKRSD